MADGLGAFRSSLAEIARSLEAHLPARDLPPETRAPAEALAGLLARAADYYRTAQPFTGYANALALRAADETMLPADPQFRGALTSFLEWTSRVTDAPPHAWDWGPAGPPDETPAQTSTDDDQEAIPLPGPDETVSFEANIKPMFREHDRTSMTFAFDLWSRDDVQAHAAGILEQLSGGTMPCDSARPPEKVQVFRRWAESGFQP